LKLEVAIVDQLHALRPRLDGGQLEFRLGERRAGEERHEAREHEAMRELRTGRRFVHPELMHDGCWFSDPAVGLEQHGT
jgi:hypothetical protein